MLGTLTWCGRMEGADGSTVLLRHPNLRVLERLQITTLEM